MESKFCTLSQQLVDKFSTAVIGCGYGHTLVFSEIDWRIRAPYSVDIGAIHDFLLTLLIYKTTEATLHGVLKEIFNYIFIRLEPTPQTVQNMFFYLETCIDYNENLFKFIFLSPELENKLTPPDHEKLLLIGRQLFGCEFPYTTPN